MLIETSLLGSFRPNYPQWDELTNSKTVHPSQHQQPQHSDGLVGHKCDFFCQTETRWWRIIWWHQYGPCKWNTIAYTDMYRSKSFFQAPGRNIGVWANSWMWNEEATDSWCTCYSNFPSRFPVSRFRFVPSSILIPGTWRRNSLEWFHIDLNTLSVRRWWKKDTQKGCTHSQMLHVWMILLTFGDKVATWTRGNKCLGKCS